MTSSPRTSLSVSVRRHFVDTFFTSHASLLEGRKVIDLGGKKQNKRGLFDLGRYASDITYVNIDRTTEPDIVADAAAVPLPDASCDAIVLGEVLEHVPEPIAVLMEAHRLLRTGGQVLATVPFIYPVHADPYDFGRYTEYYWQKAAEKAGFGAIMIERQGGFFAVLALMVQHFFRAKKVSWRPVQLPLVRFCMWLDRGTTALLFRDWTTGYGLVFTK
ncbi:methyltransferase domain-containing protein [Candidatus Parcubacteria bacterium]|nr:methyltransferase domain-containing protein [Candidatus Parcubacteria bacterium]